MGIDEALDLNQKKLDGDIDFLGDKLLGRVGEAVAGAYLGAVLWGMIPSLATAEMDIVVDAKETLTSCFYESFDNKSKGKPTCMKLVIRPRNSTLLKVKHANVGSSGG